MTTVCMQQVGRLQDTGTLSSKADAPADIAQKTPQSAGTSDSVGSPKAISLASHH